MLMALERTELLPGCTIGRLLVDGREECLTLEDRYPTPYVKVPGETAIPCGRFEVVITHSPRFNVDMPLLLNVPGFAGVRIHTGNAALDTAGCILVGQERVGEKLLHSRPAYAALFQKIQAARARGESVFLEVKLADGGVCHAESPGVSVKP